jgi:hypothetical protein
MGWVDWWRCIGNLRTYATFSGWSRTRSGRRGPRLPWCQAKGATTPEFHLDFITGELHAARSFPVLARLRQSTPLYESAGNSHGAGRAPLTMGCIRTEITDERENEYIAWRSLPGSDLEVDGRVNFRKAPANRGTLITAHLEFRPIPGASSALGKYLTKGANFAIRQDMRRLEALLETGEIPTIEGQSHGRRDLMTGVMRVADPTRPISPESNLTDVFQARRRIA